MNYLPIILIVIAVLAYFIGLKFMFEHRHTSDEERNQTFKLVPSDLIMLTIPINIGSGVNPNSLFGKLAVDLREGILAGVVIFSLIVYFACFSQGKRLHMLGRGTRFGAGMNMAWLIGQYVLAGIFLFGTVYAAR